MPAITPSRAPQRPAILPLISGTLLGTMLVVGGLTIAYVAFATPVLRGLLPGGRPDGTQMLGGMAVWAMALGAPAGFVLLGTTRLARILASVDRRVARRRGPLAGLAQLPAAVTVTGLLRLPDGRSVADLVVGPFGAAVIRELPSAAVTRVRHGNWELRAGGRWVPLENPLERATRDAERVRRWLAHDDADFLVRVYAAVVGPAPTVSRTAGCAVLSPDQLVPWIGALPTQRTLTESRRAQILEIVHEALV